MTAMAPGQLVLAEVAGLVVACWLADDDVEAVEGVDKGYCAYQGREL